MKQKELLRKFTAAAAAAVMTIALSACGAGASAGNTAKEAAASETTVIASTTAAQETGAAETTQETPAAASTEAAAASTQEAAAAGKQTDTAAGSQTDAVRVGSLKGPTTMGIVNLRKASEDGTSEGSYIFTMATQPDEIAADIAGGKLDIAMVPANLASVLYNKTKGGVSVVDINTLGVIYCVSGNTEIHSVKDLAGKTVLSTGQGATPEYALRFILSENGIDPDNDVNIEWKSEHAECLSALLESEEGVAMLPQPFVTTAMTKAEGLRVALDLTEEWNRTQEGAENPSKFLTGVTIVRKEFAEEHPEQVEAFLAAYSESVAFVNENVAEAALLIEAADIVPAAIAEKAIPACNIVFITGSEMKDALAGYLAVLADQNPQSVGGTLPKDDFYYER